jgi:nucleoside-diphosphate-sugar epimerase
MSKILVIGAAGQLGSELVLGLCNTYGKDNVIASDIHETGDFECTYELVNALDPVRIENVISNHGIDEVYHLAAILSAKAESNPLASWDLNMDSLLNVLEMGRRKIIKKIYWSSSIAVFGPSTTPNDTPQFTVMDPNTVYGISKLAGERWCEYYYQKYGVDVRSLRYPGLIGYKHAPGGGTTDYAVDIYFHAVKNIPFECFLAPETELPMMYMEDAVKATIDIMRVPSNEVKIRSSYNLGGFSVTPEAMFNAIKKHVPDFEISYKPDFRQKIADSWPSSIDDSEARKDWGWQYVYDLNDMTDKMLRELQKNAD